jgi:site-specific DNA recombinase
MTKKNNQRLRAAGYIRVSNESQVEDHSLDAQRSEIGRWCEVRCYELARIYADEGVSSRADRTG